MRRRRISAYLLDMPAIRLLAIAPISRKQRAKQFSRQAASRNYPRIKKCLMRVELLNHWWLPITLLAWLLPEGVFAQTDPPVVEPQVSKPSATEPAVAATVDLKLAEGALKVSTPAAWQKVKPRYRIIEVELAAPGKRVPEAGSNPQPPTARVTISGAGGSVEQNFARWRVQFRRPPPGTERTPAKTARREVRGMTLHTFDMSGTYMDAPRGPFGPKTPKPEHRLIAGILETEKEGKYFFKLIGPQTVVDYNAKAFTKMLDSVEEVVP